MSLQEQTLHSRIRQLELEIFVLKNEFNAFKKYRIDRHITYNCARGTCNACKGRSCRHECHNKRLDEC